MPDVVTRRNVTYKELDDSIRMIFEDSTFSCEEDGVCEWSYNMQKVKEFSEIKLPEVKEENALAYLDKQEWRDNCTIGFGGALSSIYPVRWSLGTN